MNSKMNQKKISRINQINNFLLETHNVVRDVVMLLLIIINNKMTVTTTRMKIIH